ncbi:MAG: response regulator [Nitrosomonadales bacterium]|nr:response regulator [Nitrosomonadales bacterium]
MDNMEETGKHPTVLVRPTVLVVDDTEEILMIMESILSKDYSLKLYSQPQKALEYASSNPPDLILLDVMMPDIDGFETCRRLKANPKLRDIPVIFLTSKNEDEYEEMGFSVGAADFIHKPINAPIVAARVKTHLKIKFVMDYMRNENLRLQDTAKQSSTELAELTKMLWGSPYVKF